jgi:hypothetical protein
MKIESRSGGSDPRAAVTSDRWVALSIVDETLSKAERRFGKAVEGQLLDRYALEAAIDLLSSPLRIVEFIPDPAVRQVQDRVAAGVGTNR